MTGVASSSAGPPPGEAGQPALIIDGLGCFDAWDSLALARLPLTDLLHQATGWLRGHAGRA